MTLKRCIFITARVVLQTNIACHGRADKRAPDSSYVSDQQSVSLRPSHGT